MTGNVQDPSGASISGASVTITNVATQVASTAKSDSQGNFRFVSLAPGNYEIQVSANGFDAAKIAITLDTDQTLNVPVPRME